ncbi:MAG: DUF4340 domain-containing protein [Gammaproteobacteria bacterium]|nr:DUF4340 domain-containing protein [Gammaproteobacteria bacterium]
MCKKHFIILVVLTSVLAGIAFFQGKGRVKDQEELSNLPLLFPELKDKLAEVTTLKIFKKLGVPKVTLVKNEDHWVVQEKHHYPADVKKINRLLLALSEARFLEAKTEQAENYAQLGVMSLENEKELDKGVQLEILGPGGTVFVSLLVGEYRMGANGGTHVRKPNEEKSWLASGELAAPALVHAWLDKEVIHIRPDSIQKVNLTPPKGKPFIVFKESLKEPHFVVADLSKKIKLSSEGGVDILASGLSHLYLEDILPKEAVDWKRQTAVTQVTYQLFDGLVVQGKLAKVKDKNILALQAFTEPTILKDGKDAKASLAEADNPATADTLDQFKTRLESYAYVIPGYSADLMRKRLEDFIDKTPKEETTPSNKVHPRPSPELKEKPKVETALSE